METEDLQRVPDENLRRATSECQIGLDGGLYLSRVWWFVGRRSGSCVFDNLPAQEGAAGIRAKYLCSMCGQDTRKHVGRR